MRVAIIRSGSKGALTKENARVFPSSSVSGGFSKVTSIDCPARNSKSTGLLNRNAMVPSAIASRLNRFEVWTEVEVTVAIAPPEVNRTTHNQKRNIEFNFDNLS